MHGDSGDAALVTAMVSGAPVFYARFQPVVALESNDVAGYAASLHGLDGGVEVPPARLFGMAHDEREHAALDRLGRTTALNDAAGWLGDKLLFVRLLPDMITRPHEALAGLNDVAASVGIAMSQIVIETEGAGGDNESRAHLARVVTRCRGTGTRVCLTGIADERTARRVVGSLAPDFVKLDQSVAAILRSARTAAGVRALTDAAHEGGTRVIAFGIESVAQEHGGRVAAVDLAQGWLYGRPVSAADLRGNTRAGR